MKITFLAPLMIAALIGCSDSGNGSTSNDNTPPSGDTGDRIDSEELSFHVETVVEGLMIPWSIAFLPGGVMLVTERHGALRVVRDGELDPIPVSGVPEVYAQGQGGLLDVVPHPDYANNGWLYLTYSDPGEGGAHTALMRARLDMEQHLLTDQAVLFSGMPKTSATQHFGGRAVVRDGYVFLSTGDRGDMEEAQNLSSHNGSILRLHDDGRVPDDNPFLDQPGAQPEIWTYGHRNVQGLTVHPESGELWSHEHGPRGGDEINIIRAGLNYGWPVITYGVNYDGTPITDNTEQEGMEQPATYWTPSIAPSGMAFVSGDRYPGWQGNLMVGALVGQELRRVVLDGNEVTHQETLLHGLGRIRDVRMGPDGYLYLANETNGTIVRLIPAD